MKRITIVFAAALFIGLAGAASTAQAAPAGRPAYDPFGMKRAAQAQAGSQDNNKFNRRQGIVKRLKNKMRPPHHPGNRSPHQPGEPFHDKNGDGIEDHGGHGPDRDGDDDGNNGHGNDDDGHDDSNPGQGRGNGNR